MPKKTPTTPAAAPTHGGPRPNSGRKPWVENPKVKISLRLDPDVIAYLRQHPSGITAAIESVVKETKQFRQWLSQS